MILFFFSSRRRHTRFKCDWSSDVCSSDLDILVADGNSDNGKGRIILVDPVTGGQTSIAHGDPYLDEPVGVIFDPNDNNLLVINGVAGGTQINGVVRVNP